MNLQRLIFLFGKRALQLFLGVCRNDSAGLVHKAKTWKKDTPPVMAGGGTDTDAQGFIIAGRKAQITIILYGKILIPQSDLDRIGISFHGNGFLRFLPDRRNPGEDLVSGILYGTGVRQTALEFLENGIAHLELQSLVLCGIAVGNDMETNDLRSNIFLDLFRRFLMIDQGGVRAGS